MNSVRAPISRGRLSLALRIALASALFGLVVAGGSIAVGYWSLLRQLDERSAQEIGQEVLARVAKWGREEEDDRTIVIVKATQVQ